MKKLLDITDVPSALIALSLILFGAGIAQGSDNLVPNPGFLSPDGKNPFFWQHGSSDIERVRESRFALGATGNLALNSLSVIGGEDREGYWASEITGITPNTDYVLTFMAHRSSFTNGYYPSFEIFGIRTRLNSHIKSGAWQDFSYVFNSGDNTSTTLVFYNDYPQMFGFSAPRLYKAPEKEVLKLPLPERRIDKDRLYGVFPIGVYGAGADDLADINNMGFNTVVAGLDGASPGEFLGALSESGLRAILRDPHLLPGDVDTSNILGWYISDEPEIRSEPLELISEKIEKTEKNMPGLPYFMSIVRPEYVKAYSVAADVILMDQYPVPNEPLTWLSESIDKARQEAPDREVWAVVQAFGGERWKEQGWGRLPEYDEMRVLSYLSVVHGARGLLYFNYSTMKGNTEHRTGVSRLINELKRFGDVFLSARSETVGYRAADLYRAGFDGTSPVHARIFRTPRGRYYLVAVNTLDKRVEGELTGIPGGNRYFDEFFSDKRYVVKKGAIKDRFKPYDVRIYISGNKYKNVHISGNGREPSRFQLEVANGPSAGLAAKHALSDGGGMIFTLDAERPRPFRMLNMRFPVDLLFFDRGGRLREFYEEAMPCWEESTCTRYYPPSDAGYAIELAAGTIKKLGIARGDRLYIE